MSGECKRFAGQACIVTGGASGIGLATVTEFAREGASVAIFDLNEIAGCEQVNRLKSDGFSVQFFHVDVTSPEQIQKAVTAFGEANQGQIHHLINGAVYFGSKGLQATPKDFQKTFETNVSAYAFMAQAVYPYMLKARQAGKNCSVVNIASISAHRAQPVRWTYASSKGAIVMLTKSMALDLSKDGIRVNSVSPGWTWSPEVEKAAVNGGREKWDPIWGQFHMLRRCADCREVARPILFLCSTDASFI
ncbi:unnamed protein product [Rotaria sordida]|uniref:Uncharacterized protein n=1 Tax=Rotaria sordida TaxID=392033 RepID=A0A814U5C3_9BILA|nr:unnamed protein product [Rotaria sordida]CAF1419256.1 unnamed protein product [Rotaria sordida]